MAVVQKWFTTQQVCEFLQIKESWLYELRNKKSKYYDPEFPVPSKYGRQNRYAVDRIEAYADKRMGSPLPQGLESGVTESGEAPGKDVRATGPTGPTGAAGAAVPRDAEAAPDLWTPQVVIDVERRSVHVTTKTGERVPALRRLPPPV